MGDMDKKSLGVDLLTSLYAAGAGGGEEATTAHLDLLIHLAAGFQYKEVGVVEHLRRVAAYAEILASEIGWTESKVQILKHASVFHDVGMVNIPEAVINKEGALTREEQDLLKKHTEFGHELLRDSGVPLLEAGSVIAQAHHERFDGTGYPGGLEGEAIPMTGRIVSAADVFDALTTRRPFKEPYPVEVAIDLMASKSRNHFDPEVIAALLRRREGIEAICRTMAAASHPVRKGFKMSARDMFRGDIFTIAKDAYFSCPFCKDLHPREETVCPEAGFDLSEIHKLSGIVLDEKYQLRGALGVGGMGVVYEAVHMLIGRRLAIKFLKPEAARDVSNITRFYNEARVFSTVGHPNLVEVTDMGWTHDRIPYIVMEMLIGVDLFELIHKRRGPLSPVAAMTVMIEVLRTLETVHAKGIVHRDLKPENIFFVREGAEDRLKILDFGVSRLAVQERDTRLTQEGFVFGTPQYMSPEQAQGSDYVDMRSDLFTMGVIFYEMLTGREAFPGDNALAVISAVNTGRFVPVEKIVPGLPHEIPAIIRRALQVDPGKRFQDAGEFIEALTAVAKKDPRFEPGKILDLWEPCDMPLPAEDEGGVDAGIRDKPTKKTKLRWKAP
jgi:putative nucleotidyltransferase with HDIG domain